MEKYQVFSNGLTHFADIKSGQFWEAEFHPRMIGHDINATKWEKVHEKSDGIRTVLPNNKFLHCYFESASNIMTGINEMLLQSYDEIIRVFPGVPLNYSALFTLMAVGNYSVTSQMSEGDIRFVHILSKSGGVCKVENPWDGEIFVRENNEIVEINDKDGIIIFDTQVGREYLLERAQYPISQYYKQSIVTLANKEPKVWKKNVLGKMAIYS